MSAQAPAPGPWISKRATSGYIEKTLPHYIENTGETDLQYLEVFRSSRFEDLSLSEWLSHTPPELVMAHWVSIARLTTASRARRLSCCPPESGVTPRMTPSHRFAAPDLRHPRHKHQDVGVVRGSLHLTESVFKLAARQQAGANQPRAGFFNRPLQKDAFFAS